MSFDQATSDSREDRFLAGLAHLLIVTNWVGAIGAAVIYAINRDRSPYVAFQAAQAAVYQVAVLLITIAAWLGWTALYFLSFLPIIVNPRAYPEPPAFFWLALASMVIPFAIMGLLWLYGLWGAVRAFQGRPFRYVLIGPWLARYFAGR